MHAPLEYRVSAGDLREVLRVTQYLVSVRHKDFPFFHCSLSKDYMETQSELKEDEARAVLKLAKDTACALCTTRVVDRLVNLYEVEENCLSRGFPKQAGRALLDSLILACGAGGDKEHSVESRQHSNPRWDKFLEDMVRIMNVRNETWFQILGSSVPKSLTGWAPSRSL